MEIKIKVSDEMLLLMKYVDYEPSTPLAVFREEKFSVDKLNLFFELIDKENRPPPEEIVELGTKFYLNMGWGSYQLEKMDAL